MKPTFALEGIPGGGDFFRDLFLRSCSPAEERRAVEVVVAQPGTPEALLAEAEALEARIRLAGGLWHPDGTPKAPDEVLDGSP